MTDRIPKTALLSLCSSLWLACSHQSELNRYLSEPQANTATDASSQPDSGPDANDGGIRDSGVTDEDAGG